MILEGLVSTRNPDGTPHLAPMGPTVDGFDFHQFELRPFATSQTYQNMLIYPHGVLHITDDALLIAQSAIGSATDWAFPKKNGEGLHLSECHRYYEFSVVAVDDSGPRIRMNCEVTARGQGSRPWFGFNRARHAVLEAAILATRVHLLPNEQIETEFRVFNLIVEKTGGDDEKKAMQLLVQHVRERS